VVVVVIEHKLLLLLPSSFSLCSLELEALWLVLGSNPSQLFLFYLFYFLCYFVGFCGWLVIGPNPSQPFFFLNFF